MLYSEEFLHRNPFPEWFDAHLLGGHPQVEAILDGEVFEVDEKLKDLLERINKELLLTIQSCQYNFFGWSTVSCTY